MHNRRRCLGAKQCKFAADEEQGDAPDCGCLLQIATAQDRALPGFCDSNSWASLNFSLDALFWLDILLTFRTGWVDSRYVIHMRPGEAAWNYLKSWFAVDLVSSFPFEAIVYGAQQTVFNCLA